MFFDNFDNLLPVIVPPYGRRNVIVRFDLCEQLYSRGPVALERAVHGAVPREEGSRRMLHALPPIEQKKRNTKNVPRLQLSTPE